MAALRKEQFGITSTILAVMAITAVSGSIFFGLARPWEPRDGPASLVMLPAAAATKFPTAVPLDTRLPAPTPTAGPAEPTDQPDRLSCYEILGTQYRSSAERNWFLENCRRPTPIPQLAVSLLPTVAAPPPVAPTLDVPPPDISTPSPILHPGEPTGLALNWLVSQGAVWNMVGVRTLILSDGGRLSPSSCEEEWHEAYWLVACSVERCPGGQTCVGRSPDVAMCVFEVSLSVSPC